MYEAGVRDARTVHTYYHPCTGCQRLHGCKEAAGNEVSTLADHILLTGFVGLQQEQSPWHHSYGQDDLAQKEHRIQQDMLRCSMDIATCKAKIIRLDFELALL